MSSWQVAVVARDMFEARFYEKLLQDSGIPVILQGESLGELYALHTGPLAEVRLLVPAELVQQVKSILSAQLLDCEEDL